MLLILIAVISMFTFSDNTFSQWVIASQDWIINAILWIRYIRTDVYTDFTDFEQELVKQLNLLGMPGAIMQ